MYGDPSQYYELSRAWTHDDAPRYDNRDKYPKTRFPFIYTREDEELMKNRQTRTWVVAAWALDSAIRAFLES